MRPHRRVGTSLATAAAWLVLATPSAEAQVTTPPAPQSAQQAQPDAASPPGEERIPASEAGRDPIRGPGGITHLAILPFRVHSADSRDLLIASITDLLAVRLEASGTVEVVDPDLVRAALGPLDPTQEELLDSTLRSLAVRLGADAVITGSLTELAGRFSLDVRVVPVAPAQRSRTIVFTASSEEALLGRVAEVADRAAASLREGGPGPVLEVEIAGAGDLQEDLRSELETEVGATYNPDVAQADAERLTAHPSVASTTVETERSPSGVRVRFRVLRAEMIFGGTSFEPEGETVAKIEIRGNRRIEADAIKSRIRTRAGENLRPAQLAADVREVFSLGFFRNVRVLAEDGPDGTILIFEVEENPVVRQIAIAGNENIDSEQVRDALTLTTGSTLDYPLLHENTQRIEALYRADGYYLAKVSYEIQSLAPGSVAVNFEVEENKKLRLREVAFSGIEAFDAGELRKGFATKRWRWWSWATSWFDKSGTYSEPLFIQDLRKVEKLYTDNGYLQVEVGQPDVEALEDRLVVTVPIVEGDQYSVGIIDIAGDETADFELLREKLKLESGDIFNRSFLTEDVQELEEFYTDRGFYFASIQPLTKLDPDALKVDVEFRVEKGPLYFIRHVDISGNTRTVDKVIRREMKAVEGQLYSARAIQLSTRRIRRLGYFEDVAFEPRPTEDPSQLDLDVNVVERPTGSFSFGAGFSSQDRFVFTASLSQQNLFGRGYATSLSADIGGSTNRFSFSFNDPYFLGSTFSLGMSVFLTSVRFQDFNQDRRGVDISLGHSLREDNTARGFLRYSYSNREISQSQNVNTSAVLFRELFQGVESTSLVGLSFQSDTRDDRFAPTSGTTYGATVEYAGLGGFSKFLRFEGRFSWYLGAPGWLFDRSTFVFGARLGYAIPFNTIDDYDLLAGPEGGCDEFSCDNVAALNMIDTDIELPLTERYFLGGLGTFQLRGFRARSLGPRRAILKRSGLQGTGQLFHPVGTQLAANPVGGGLVAVCNDRLQDNGNPNQGNANGKCNNLDDTEIDDFDDLNETDVIGGNSFISTTFEYRFPISEEIGLQGVVFVDGGNAFAESDGNKLFNPAEWRYGVGGGVLWFSPFGPLQLILGFPIDALPVEDSPVFEFSVGGFGL